MIWRPRWRQETTHTDDSPFNSQPSLRSLRLTVHAPDETTSVDDRAVLATIREILRPEYVECLDTATEATKQLQVEVRNEGAEERGFANIYNRDHNKIGEAVFWPESWRRVAAEVSSDMAGDLGQTQQDVWVAAGHESWAGDLLVTTSRTLIANRKHPSFRLSNICTPTEAGKILGLYLRFRQHWGFTANHTFDANWFYSWLLGATFQPLHFGQRALGHNVLREFEGVSETNHSISVRARRALEAQDAIGVQFYRKASWRTAEVMLYHFDYLTLLLVGAFDAAARVARRVLGLPDKPRQVNFWKPEFLKHLEADAPLVHQVANSADMQAMRPLLYYLRNKIHDAKLGQMMYEAVPAPTVIIAKLHPGDWPDMANAMGLLGGTDEWGFVSVPDGAFEPYTYARKLLGESFQLLAKVLDAIADSLAAIRPDLEPVMVRTAGPWGHDIVRRVSVL